MLTPPNTVIKLTEDLRPGDILHSYSCGPTSSFLSIVFSITLHLEYRGSMIITVLEEGEIHEIETQLGEEFECLVVSP